MKQIESELLSHQTLKSVSSGREFDVLFSDYDPNPGPGALSVSR